ncbi:uncharacterized protein EI90DRAFT_2994962 [Cantharellus anzutake]|uniref:uncharacterized protein n=1 Tax=Cantharellus anzutake TaxID=1750568 RepID=UPI001905C02E|nr:uncharacterized protein EI90DRAFT_2994962 [Cantharellus anzutake]KAF8332688.1 hypothetical protein EI90DRAFT_2994962 [Cantharellus anzutake]
MDSPSQAALHDAEPVSLPVEVVSPGSPLEVPTTSVQEETERAPRLSIDSASSHETIQAVPVRAVKESTISHPFNAIEVPPAVSEEPQWNGIATLEHPPIPSPDTEPDIKVPPMNVDSEILLNPSDSSQASLQSMQEAPLSPSSPPPPIIFPLPKPVSTSGRLESIAALSPAPSPVVNDSRRPSGTLSHGRNSVSLVHITSALDIIAASKEAKKAGPLKESIVAAQDVVRSDQAGDRPRVVFEPLRLACETKNEKLMIASLDCISKLVSHSFLSEVGSDVNNYASPPASPTTSSASQAASLADLVTHTITSAYSESTSDAVSLQIVKALLSLVLSSTILVHHSSLLKAVRTVYNVFLLSTDTVNQTVAQGGLSQMINHVFTRCSSATKDPHSPSVFVHQYHSRASPLVSKRDSAVAGAVPGTVPGSTIPSPPASPETSQSNDRPVINEGDDSPKEVSESLQVQNGEVEHDPEVGIASGPPMTLRDLFIKDAFLVFRALCKLTMKPLATESERDLKSHAMRSKLLSLHLVLATLDSHTSLFVDPTAMIYSSSTQESNTMLQAVKQYLLLSLSRNAVSPVQQVFDISVEIYWRIISGMRTKLKKEIEVLLNEIFLPILEMRNSTVKQKMTVLSMLHRLCEDSQALVEIYLNYDCDREALENIYERLMNIISKISSVTTPTAVKGTIQDASPSGRKQSVTSFGSNGVPPSLTTSALGATAASEAAAPPTPAGAAEARLKRQGLECLVSVLRSLVSWGTASSKGVGDSSPDPQMKSRKSLDGTSETHSQDNLDRRSPANVSDIDRGSTPNLVDDPERFESAKQRKTTLLEGIKKFNFKPKRGVQFLIDTGFIESRDPKHIAKFLLETDGLSKAMIGEYLGEGEEENIAIMHAFVDTIDFSDLPFVDALRAFLQAFRLPGEAQKIDRYMLKFAARYMQSYNGSVFANADTVYVLAYSTILLNTDAYNPQVKRRMTKADFVKNNRGINDNQDLPEDFLSSIYDSIYAEEIRMKDEIETSMLMNLSTATPGLAGALANVGRDLQKEAYIMQSTGMANKTEAGLALFKSMMRAQRKGKSTDQFYSASHFVHVKPMFEVAWMPFLAGLSGPLQDTDDLDVVDLCLTGFKAAIRIVCFFELELERNAFVTTLAKFTFLNNLGEMKTKNMEAIKTLLDVAVNEGNNLRGSWHEVLTCVSQLERMQVISSGKDEGDSRRGGKGRSKKLPAEELAHESRSTHITIAADMVFSLSHYLNGTAIVDFVQALSDVSWEEIQSSGLSEHPRLFSLQKLVDISYYNMNRIRLEWSNMWVILGEHFNQVCCHNNPNVAFFALDALRQLAMRFLEKEELPLFKFQKDFLKPFEFTMIHNQNPDVRDMVLQCLQQMLQLRVVNMRSGWRTIFGVFSAASKVLTERVAMAAFDIVTRLNKEQFPSIVRHGAFADLTVCMTDFSKVSKYQKISLLSINMLRGIIPIMLRSPECGLANSADPSSPSTSVDDPMIKFWYPVLFSFYDIIMNGEDLEVRRLALDALFSTLKKYGSTFPLDFWDTVCQELLFPIFSVLRSSQDLSRFHTQEDMSVWLSTTMIQALRNLIDLYTFYFKILEHTLDGLLDLLCVCICQENDTLARIGTSCFQQLLENNVSKLSVARWERVVTAFVRLFKTTTPHQLFDESLRIEQDTSTESSDNTEASSGTLLPAPLSPGSESPTMNGITLVVDRRRIFKQIIVKCVLQLLLIETTHELLQNQEVYTTIPPEQLLRLMAELDHSYQFAREFNADRELRTGLWKVGFMKHLPNLLKQESSSASTLVNVLIRMYRDRRPEYQSTREQIMTRLVPLGLGVMEDFNLLKAETQAKNIAAWTPVVTEVLNGFVCFDDQAFTMYLPALYPLATDLLSRDMSPELREALQKVLKRVGQSKGIIERT